MYSRKILTKPEGESEDVVSIHVFLVYTDQGWNNEFTTHVKLYFTCTVYVQCPRAHVCSSINIVTSIWQGTILHVIQVVGCFITL